MMKHLLPAAFFLGFTALATAQNWPTWRGPNYDGISTEKGFPTKWSQTENVAWKFKLPAKCGSSPVVWENTIFLTSPGDGKNQVICLNRSGEKLWQTAVGTARRGKHKKASAANPSPVTDGKHVWVYFKSGDVACLDFNGKIIWQKNLQKMYGKDTLWWDLATSPVLTDDCVVITCMHSGPSYLVGLEKETGKVAWKIDRNLGAPVEAAQSYTTPVVVSQNGKKLIVILGADFVTAHNAADGKELWRCGGFNPTGHKYYRSISSPVVAEGMVFAPYARGSTLTAVKLGGTGDVTKSHRAWNFKGASADVPTPVARNGRVYVCSDRGVITCLDTSSGKTIWSKQVEKGRGGFSSSPVLADGKIYILREDGTGYVLKEGDEFELLGRNSLNENSLASICPTRGQLLIRTAQNLYCIGK